MSYKPILFNGEMVWAILDGRKTMTRRVIKPLLEKDGNMWTWKSAIWPISNISLPLTHEDDPLYRLAPIKPGDILWVRETWTKDCEQYYFRTDFDSDYLDPCETLSGGYPHECTYYPGCDGCTRGKSKIHFRPSIHMPKEAARLFLRVTGVRLERLQDIDDENVIAEGLEIGAPFETLWDSTIKKKDRDKYGWGANPWVWVYTFERVDKPEGWALCV